MVEQIIMRFTQEVAKTLVAREPVYLNPVGVLRVKELPTGRRRVWLTPSEELARGLGDQLVAALGAANSRYAKALQRATPKWLTAAQRLQMEAFYRECPPGMAVDHIVPIRGKTVSGLHVPWNLQYLDNRANFIKGNKHDDELVRGVGAPSRTQAAGA